MNQESESQSVSLLKDLQKRVMYLEKKMDLLIEQTKGRGAGPGRSSSDSRSTGPKRSHDRQSASRNPKPGRSFDKKPRSVDRKIPTEKPAHKFKPHSKFSPKKPFNKGDA